MLLFFPFLFWIHLAVPAMAQVDLHSHQYLKPGLGPLLRGSSNEDAKSKSPSSRINTKATDATLLSTGASRITVVSLHAHPWLSSPLKLNFRENVELALESEYQQLLSFLRQHRSEFLLARNAMEARAGLLSGKKILILSIEGAFGALETESDLTKWVEERGVAMVGPFHLTEDYFGGTALMSPLISLLTSPIAFLNSLLLSGGACLNSFCTSPMGLKPAGRDLIARLLERRVWIDLAHANELERKEILPELQKRNLPLLISHSTLESHFVAERSLSVIEIEYLTKSGGIVGLIPSDDYLEDGVSGTCLSGLIEFKKQIQSLESKIGKGKVMIGSDFNAPLKGLSPICKAREGELVSAFENSGFFRQDQFKSLSDYVSSEPGWTRQSEEVFLSTWEKVRPN